MFAVNLSLHGKAVVVVGAGAVATAKIPALLDAGAEVMVVAPNASTEVQAWAAQGRVRWSAREIAEADVASAWYVVAAASPAANRAVAAWAARGKIFANVVDDLALATAHVPAVINRGPIRVAVSTNGQAPALAGVIREAIEDVLPRAEDATAWLGVALELRRAWKQRNEPHARRRLQLGQAIAKRYVPELLALTGGRRGRSLPAGHVALVGAGPGGLATLTLEAAWCLAEADVVLHDALVSSKVLALAVRAEKLAVGKRADAASADQRDIERQLIAHAQQGRRVVRLKGGDPLVFGRGGEEAMALGAAGIACKIVPGVSSSLAAPALAGIPVTHRGVASSFTVVSGHDPASWQPVIDAAAPATTLVILMGIRQRAAIAQRMIAYGRAAATPVAIAYAAGTPDAWVWRGTVGALAADHAPPPPHAGVIVIGEVSALELTASPRAVAPSTAAFQELS